MPGCCVGGDLTISRHDRHAQMPRGGDQWTIGRIAVKRNGKCALSIAISGVSVACLIAGAASTRANHVLGSGRKWTVFGRLGLLRKPISQAEIGEMYTPSASPAWVITSAAGFAIGSPFARYESMAERVLGFSIVLPPTVGQLSGRRG
jgi:hypothetical protein